MSDTVQIATAFFALIGTMFSAYIGLQMAKLNQQTKAAAVKVEEVAVKQETAAQDVRDVKDTLEQNTAAQQSTAADHGKAIAAMAVDTRATRQSVDGAMSAMLEKFAIAERRWANSTKLPHDLMAADLAEKALADHKASEREIADGGTP